MNAEKWTALTTYTRKKERPQNKLNSNQAEQNKQFTKEITATL